MFRYTLTSMLLLWLLDSSTHAAVEFYVSPGGSDANPGTRDLPFATLDHARQAVASRADRSEPVTVFLAGGTYYLPDTLVFQANDSGTREAPVTYTALSGQIPVISGGQRLQLNWSAYKDGIMQATVPPGTTADQLFVNGRRQIMARYPDFEEAPWLCRLADQYYLWYASSIPESIHYAIAKSPVGPWQYGGEVMDNRKHRRLANMGKACPVRCGQ